MNAARQALRYSIPGGVYLLFVGFFIVLSEINRTLLLASSEVESIARSVLVGVTLQSEHILAAIVASIPIGFILYQFYYTTVTVGVTDHLSIVRLDRAALVLRGLCNTPSFTRFEQRSSWQFTDTKDMIEHRAIPSEKANFLTLTLLASDHRNRQGRREYRARALNNLNGLRLLLNAFIDDVIGRELKDEYTTLSDIYHAIGASQLAILLALGFYLAIQLMSPLSIDRPFLLVFCNSVAAIVISSVTYLAFSHARSQTWHTAAHLLRSWLSALLQTRYGSRTPDMGS